MNKPYLSTSIRNFWSVRWNVLVQRALRRAVFDPVLKFFGYPAYRKPVPYIYLVIAGLSTFLFSGLIHEWITYVITTKAIYMEQLTFFVLQGLLANLEIIIVKFFRDTFGINLGKVVPSPPNSVYPNCDDSCWRT
jgi:hypothetical protein